MPDHTATGRSGSGDFPLTDHAPPGAYQLREHIAAYDVRPPALDDAAMCTAIDEIHNQLARDLPKLQHEMDELLIRVRKPGLT